MNVITQTRGSRFSARLSIRHCTGIVSSLVSESLPKKADPRSILIFCIIFCITLVFSRDAFAQSPATMRYGGFLAGAGNIHTGAFTALPGVAACCPEYRLGTGVGGSVGVVVDVPMSLFRPTNDASEQDAETFAKRFFLSFRADAALQDAQFIANEPALISIDGTRIQAVFRHTLAARIRSAGAQVLGAWKPFDSLGLSFYAGLRGAYLWQTGFSQREELLEPTGRARYVSGLQERNVASGAALPQILPLQASLVAGLGWDIPLTADKTVILTPEIIADYGLTTLVGGLAWQINALKGGFALRYAVPPPEIPPLPLNVDSLYFAAGARSALAGSKAESALQGDSFTQALAKEFAPKALPPPKILRTPLEIVTGAPGDDLRLIVNAVAVDSLGKESGLVRVVTEEFISAQMYPLLAYIFFDRFSGLIPARYRRLQPAEAQTFDEARLTGAETLDIYYTMLNVVGQRMKRNTASTLRIVGCLGKIGLGPESEENAPQIALRRAEAVAEYLRNVWGIAANRLKLESRGLPEKSSNATDVALGEEDNRRVELYSDDWNILKPVLVYDTLRISNPPDVVFRMQAFWRGRPATVTEWALDLTQDKKFLRQVRENGALPPEYVWNLNARRASAPRVSKPVEFSLFASDAAGREGEAESAIPVELRTVQEKRRKRVADKEIDEYRLINFAFEQSQLSLDIERIMVEFVRPNVKDESTILVRGYTDITGTAAINQRISQERAEAIATAITRGKRTAKGLGSSIIKYPNELPEGRFYSRTVEVRVETPVR